MDNECVGKFYEDDVRLQKISKERNKLRRIIRTVSKDKKTLCDPLIENIAFSIVQLEELRELIKRDGYYETYQNGENQKGLKKSIASDLIISVGKNYSMYLQRLKDFLPPDVVDDDLDKFNKEHRVE